VRGAGMANVLHPPSPMDGAVGIAGFDKLGITYIPSCANFVLGRFGSRALEVRDKLRDQAILVRDRSYEAAGCVRITAGTREQTRRLLTALEEIWNA